MVSKGSYVSNFDYENYQYYCDFEMWNLFDSYEYSLTQVLTICRMAGLKFGAFDGLLLDFILK